MNKAQASKEYNKIVNYNFENKFSNYKDPDQVFSETVTPIICIPNDEKKEITINMSSDGLCSIKKIKEICNEKNRIKGMYELLREDMFDCLIWPAYSISINQMRSNKGTFNDRIDLTLIDIQKFYNIVESKKLSIEILNNIVDKCILGRAYLNSMTLSWLCSFENFDDFIDKRHLQAFVTDKNNMQRYNAEIWTKNKNVNEFDRDYFNALCERVGTYKNDKTINSNLFTKSNNTKSYEKATTSTSF